MSKFVICLADDESINNSTIEKFINSYDGELELIYFQWATDLVRYLRRNPKSIDMLFLDLIFENSVSGLDVLPKIRELNSDLPIVLLTGAGMEPKDIGQYTIKYNVRYLPKPYSNRSLASEVELAKLTVIDQKKSRE